jgi:hypothetical protein
VIESRSGRVLSTDREVVKCARYATLLTAGSVCQPTGSQGIETTGKVELATARFGEPGIRPLTVDLGGAYTSSGGKQRFTTEAVPGAVIAYSEFQPADGRRIRLTGLR